ncbi:hypothetical protein RI367_006091 [Sorochytrium milnesiophthora]
MDRFVDNVASDLAQRLLQTAERVRHVTNVLSQQPVVSGPAGRFGVDATRFAGALLAVGGCTAAAVVGVFPAMSVQLYATAYPAVQTIRVLEQLSVLAAAKAKAAANKAAKAAPPAKPAARADPATASSSAAAQPDKPPSIKSFKSIKAKVAALTRPPSPASSASPTPAASKQPTPPPPPPKQQQQQQQSHDDKALGSPEVHRWLTYWLAYGVTFCVMEARGARRPTSRLDAAMRLLWYHFLQSTDANGRAMSTWMYNGLIGQLLRALMAPYWHKV